MLNADFVKSLAGLESHRGIGYIAFFAAMISPSLLVLYLGDPATAKANIAATILVASSVGSILTCVLAVGVFVIFAQPESPARQFKKAGAVSLVFGSALSLVMQGLIAYNVLFMRSDSSFRDYVELVLQWGFIAFGCLMTMSMIVDFVRSRRAAKSSSEDTV